MNSSQTILTTNIMVWAVFLRYVASWKYKMYVVKCELNNVISNPSIWFVVAHKLTHATVLAGNCTYTYTTIIGAVADCLHKKYPFRNRMSLFADFLIVHCKSISMENGAYLRKTNDIYYDNSVLPACSMAFIQINIKYD